MAQGELLTSPSELCQLCERGCRIVMASLGLSLPSAHVVAAQQGAGTAVAHAWGPITQLVPARLNEDGSYYLQADDYTEASTPMASSKCCSLETGPCSRLAGEIWSICCNTRRWQVTALVSPVVCPIPWPSLHTCVANSNLLLHYDIACHA
jgi:hypothetical protein